MRTASCLIMALFFAVAGLAHFVSPGPFVEIVPPYLPWPRAIVYLSGAAEIILALAALCPPPIRVLAAWGLIALLCAVFPANIQMALHGFHTIPAWILWVRLPFQFVLIAWAYWSCVADRSGSGRA